MSLLTLRNVTRVHGHGPTAVTALHQVTLSVRPGELVAVMGPSGSGKSTLLNIAGGLDRQTTGSVKVDGVALEDLGGRALAALRRRSIGYVFQDLNLLPALTAAENVSLPRELDGVAVRQARDEALATLDKFGLADVADRFPDDLSGGEQQRVAIARAFIGERKLLLADEPTGALDSVTGEDVLQILREHCTGDVAGVLVTHEARHAAFADRVVFLRDGRVVDVTDDASSAPPPPPRRTSTRGGERPARQPAASERLRRGIRDVPTSDS
jgi:putative ABC transport system ATP-binding protein